MDNLKLYLVQIVLVIEDRWFLKGYAPHYATRDSDPANPPIRSVKAYCIQSHLIAAVDAEAAYAEGCTCVEGSHDANHDGKGHLTLYYSLGIHDIESLSCTIAEFHEKVQEIYGLDAGVFRLNDVGPTGIPLVRAKDDLEIFRKIPPPRVA